MRKIIGFPNRPWPTPALEHTSKNISIYFSEGGRISGNMLKITWNGHIMKITLIYYDNIPTYLFLNIPTYYQHISTYFVFGDVTIPECKFTRRMP